LRLPASRYRSSPRAYPERLPALEYPGHFLVKKITTGGTFRFGSNKLLYLANAMVDQHIGLEETDDGIWAIHFNTILLAPSTNEITSSPANPSVTNHAGHLCYSSSRLFRRRDPSSD
jgi:hypothetical protein